MNRGARRAAIFGEPWMAALFLQVLAELPDRFGIVILAYAVMPNHFHLLVRSPDAQLSRAMKYLGAEFTQRLNRKLAWDGPVFRGRFKNCPAEDEAYIAHLFAYIHLNPVAAGLATCADAAPWTSHRALVGLEPCPDWVHAPGLLTSHGTVEAYAQYLADCLAGLKHVPPGGDPDHLWRSVEASLEPAVSTTGDPELLLADVAAVTSVPVERILASGGRGNDARAMGAWWLARGMRWSNLRVGATLGCSGPRVSQLRGIAEADDAPFPAWREGLLARSAESTSKMMLLRDSPMSAYAA